MTAAIRKAVIPAAGLGTRFLPVTRSVPKELLPILDRPMLQYVVAEAAEAGIAEVIVVTAPGKEGIAGYFRPQPELEERLAGNPALLERARSGAGLAKVSYVIQERPLGLGHAVLTAREAVGAEPFAVILPDDIIDHTPGALSQMLAMTAAIGGGGDLPGGGSSGSDSPGNDSGGGDLPGDGDGGAADAGGIGVVAVERVAWERAHNYGVVDARPAGEGVAGEGVHRVEGLVEKPPPGTAPSNLSIVGRYLLPPQIFECLEHTRPGAGGEIQLTDGLARLMEDTPLYAVEFAGVRYDGGSPMGLLRAGLEYALRRDDTRAAAAELIRNLAEGL